MVKYAKDANAPKRAQSAYFLFMADVRDEIIDGMSGDFNLGAVGKAIGKAWGKLSNAKKAPYQTKAAAAKAKFDKANAKYKMTPGYTSWCEGREAHKKAAKATEKRNSLKAMLINKPARGLSGYMRFCNANRKNYTGGVAEVGAQLGKAWAEASDSAKAKFLKAANADKAKYDKAMAKYVQTEEYQSYEAAFKEHRTEQYKIKNYGTLAAANKAERTRLAARANKKKAAAQKEKLRARKAAIRA